MQNTPEWLEEKKKYVGASEIFALACYYCDKEINKSGINLLGESSFQTPLEIFLEKKFNSSRNSIDKVLSEFGLGMEGFIIDKLKKENEELLFYKSKDYFISDKHKLAAYSPDGSIDIKKNHSFKDFDKKNTITSDWGSGELELKTCNYGFNFESKLGAKWQYIFQLQYQMLCSNRKWGMIACLVPNEQEYDTPFEKGKTLGLVNSYFKNEIDNKYTIKKYIYVASNAIQKICLLALDRFSKAMEDNLLPAISVDNKAKLLREKKMLSQLQPSRFGEVYINKDDKEHTFLDHALNELWTAQNEKIKVETEIEALKCEIIKKMKDNISFFGTSYQSKFNKKGHLMIKANY